MKESTLFEELNVGMSKWYLIKKSLKDDAEFIFSNGMIRCTQETLEHPIVHDKKMNPLREDLT